MKFVRFSIAELLGAVGLVAVGLACLMFASSPWAGAAFSINLAALTLAPLGVAYRRGERRAGWAGFLVCGWAYLACTFGPWVAAYVAHHLVTTKLLKSAYTQVVPDGRRPLGLRRAQRTFDVPNPELGEGLDPDWPHGSVDVSIKGEGETPPLLLVAGVDVGGYGKTLDTVTTVHLLTSPTQFAILTQAPLGRTKFVLSRHQPGVFGALWVSPAVQEEDFLRVGHSLFGLLCAWAGSLAGRYFYATRDPAPGSA